MRATVRNDKYPPLSDLYSYNAAVCITTCFLSSEELYNLCIVRGAMLILSKVVLMYTDNRGRAHACIEVEIKIERKGKGGERIVYTAFQFPYYFIHFIVLLHLYDYRI